MSGFVAILNTGGAPVDMPLLSALTGSLAFRGPDAQQVWSSGSVGMGHALLCTTREAEGERQPLSLNGGVWIVADARVDDRQGLVDALRQRPKGPGPAVSLHVSDAELILRAYLAWGEDCLDHLIGDFTFVIWDAPRRRLFAARDHFGVKPLFYAYVGGSLAISNTVDCLRRHPSVSQRLNDQAIADFLLFDINKEPGTTSFADIQRLPAAHLLHCDANGPSLRRYWKLDVAEPVLLKPETEYLARFENLLDQAVADRLRSPSVGVLMSGGLDSPIVAAAATRAQARRGYAPGVFACTAFVEHLIPDDERHFAGLVANALNIPIEFQSMDNCVLFEGADRVSCHSAQPEYLAWPDYTAGQLLRMAMKSRVVLTGQGSDPGLSSRITLHFLQLMKDGQYVRAVGDAARYLGAENRFSRLYLRSRWRSLFSVKNPFYSYPDWLNKDFEREFGLRDRWMIHAIPDRKAARRYESQFTSAAYRPEANGALTHISWQNVFEAFDPGATRVPVEVRHPFFDVRLATFLAGLPRLPWCCDKELLRRSVRGVLPDSVRLRRKAPLRGDPVVSLLQKPESEWVDHFDPAPDFERYVVRSQVPAVYKESRSWAAWLNLKPLSLNFWLRGVQSAKSRAATA